MNKIIEFYNPVKIIFGIGSLETVGVEAKNLGNKALIVLGKKSIRKYGILGKLIHLLETNDVKFTIYEGIESDPSVKTIDKGKIYAKKEKCNLVIAIGGGSVLDAGKAISALITNQGSAADYQEIDGMGRNFLQKTVPFIAIPTTSGTGSEVTRNAVITNIEKGLKKSIRDDKLFPEIALIDPELTISLPPKATAICGGDALTQCIESYLGKKSQKLTDILALQGIELIGKSLIECVKNGNNLQARKDMSMAALLSGICLSNSGLGIAHALSHPLGVYYKIPHGLSCAVLLPLVMEYALSFNAKKIKNIAQSLGVNTSGLSDEKAGIAAIEKVHFILLNIGIEKNLHSWQIQETDFPRLIKDAQGSNLYNSPGKICDDDLIKLLLRIK